MVNKNTDAPQVDGNAPRPSPGPPSGPPENTLSRTGNKVFKSGPLYISSKGIGWTSWKKRWFILTRTSLVFFRSDPSVTPQRGGEVNLTLGGIDLNNSGSVIVKADKKLLTVQFPDGRDGRTFTLKTETLEELHEWKEALESALAQAPTATLATGQNGILNKDQTDAATPAPADDSPEKPKDKEPAKSAIVGRPVLLALEEVDGSPSFLEKALQFIEERGVKVEGILRQAASVDDVERRIREYEQGKCEFSPDEDAHVVGDCIKYVLRELTSSPVPASCCNALVEARRADRGNRVNAMRIAICETFPEPNRHLLQRILNMMEKVASHKAENRMSVPAVAACMAPLLLRPLLAGDCELESDFDVGGDGSIQLLQAAAAANHAQAIVITLMEEYDNIFGEGYLSPGLYTDSEESGTGSEEVSDEEGSYEDGEEDRSGSNISYATGDEDDRIEHSSGASCSGSGSGGSPDEMRAGQVSEISSSDSKFLKLDDECEPMGDKEYLLPPHSDRERNEISLEQTKHVNESEILTTDVNAANHTKHVSVGHIPASSIMKSPTLPTKPDRPANPRSGFGRTSARKNLSMESIDYGLEEDEEVQKLEAAKLELQNRIADEAGKNAMLQSSLEKRKEALLSRRLALEQQVARLQEQLQKECELRATLESILESREALPASAVIDDKTKADLEEVAKSEAEIVHLEQKVNDLGYPLTGQHDLGQQASTHQGKSKDKHDDLFDRSSPRSKGHQDDLDAIKSGNERHESSSSLNQVSNNSALAVSKLTTRLNFLKERHIQIANELHNFDKSRSSGRSAQNREVSDSEGCPKMSESSSQNLEAGAVKKEKEKKVDECEEISRGESQRAEIIYIDR